MTPKDWRPIRLGDVCTKIGSGATPKGGSKVYLEKGPVALIRSQNVHNDGFRTDGLAFITFEHAHELDHVEVLSGDVLLNITGESVARCCQVPDDVLPARVNQHVAIIRPDPRKLWPGFVRYVLVSPQKQAELLSLAAAGATRAALTKKMIEDLHILAPASVAEQRAIASILGALDAKIERLRRMNQTLEAIARALFKSWFVEFEPVTAAMQGDGASKIPQEFLGLFPEHFDETVLGPVPSGWRVSEIGAEVTVVGGSTPSTKEPQYWEGGSIPFATPKDLSGLQAPILLDTEKKITEAGLARISSGLLPKGTVLLSSRAPIGYLAIAGMPVAVNQGFIAMICDKQLPNYYVLNWAYFNMEVIKSRANGTTFLEVSKTNFRPIKVIVPPTPLLQVFQQLVEPIYAAIVRNLRENRTLKDLRDLLLPKLVSGQIRISDAEKIVGEAL